VFVDSHCHINFPELAADLPAVFEAMAGNRVTHAMCIGVNLPDLPQVLALADEHANIYASVGVHPDYDLTVDGRPAWHAPHHGGPFRATPFYRQLFHSSGEA